MVAHLHVYFKKHHTLKKFSAEGVEKNNDCARRTYLRGSNLVFPEMDVILNERIKLFLEDCGAGPREKRTYIKRKMEYWNDLPGYRKKPLTSAEFDRRRRGEMASEEEQYNFVCSICEQGNNEESLLLCDNSPCNKAAHLFCLNPPLLEVPEDDWFCGCTGGPYQQPTTTSSPTQQPISTKKSSKSPKKKSPTKGRVPQKSRKNQTEFPNGEIHLCE
eukprot:Lithocolla_globosa_v1_NODE_1758_length_2360_cov_4.501518.p1 type:complete len:217 gc:universal NODE_1758_length_2360_cov_4.501518:797-1447(+)